MNRELLLRNRQRSRRVNTLLLRQIASAALDGLPAVEDWEIGIHLVAAREIAHINETFLRHDGPTDVITFDHLSGVPSSSGRPSKSRSKSKPRTLHGEIFVCLDEALLQARRFRTTWQSELVRYIIHGLLHLLGYDDTTVAARRAMKREENRLLKELARRFPLRKLVGEPKMTP
jgi:probable rRNA maturation factor